MALGTAGVINLAMLFVAAAVFSRGGSHAADPIVAAHARLGRLVGGGAALAFAVALLASGLSSSSVGTYAGQVVMQGFIGRRIPLFTRRAVTMLPALIVLGAGLPATESLVISQVVLSFGIPFALIPLVLLTRRADIMGSLVNSPLTTAVAACVAALIAALNLSCSLPSSSADRQGLTQVCAGTAISPSRDQSSCGILKLTILGVSAR